MVRLVCNQYTLAGLVPQSISPLNCFKQLEVLLLSLNRLLGYTVLIVRMVVAAILPQVLAPAIYTFINGPTALALIPTIVSTLGLGQATIAVLADDGGN